MPKILINAAIFQAGWLLSVWFGSLVALAVSALAIATYLVWYLRSREELWFLLCVIVLGVTGDVVLGATGVLRYPGEVTLPPFWMVTLWLLFASTLPWALRWLVEKPRWFIPLCGISGPLSYVIGVSQSAVTFGVSKLVAIGLMVVIWLIYGFIIDRLYRTWRHQF